MSDGREHPDAGDGLPGAGGPDPYGGPHLGSAGVRGPEPGGMDVSRGFPWPPAEGESVLAAFGETWKSSTFDPSTFFARMPKSGGTGAAILYYLVIGMLVAGAGLFWNVGGITSRFDASATPLDPLISFLLSPVVLVLALVVSAAVSHLILLIASGARHGFATTLRVYAFAYSPVIFGVIPFLGTIVGVIWMAVLAIIGLREGHETDGWKAALAVLLPFAIALGLVMLVAMMLIAAGAALMAG